jgi:adenosylcobinamide kinase/adenosylcobinamide-phosphate guanylyltransferase
MFSCAMVCRMNTRTHRITLVTGGSRSGKSRYAMEAALQYKTRVFLATATACDSEMKARIDAHQAERGARFTLIEEPTDPASVLRRLPTDTDVVLLDCLTVWIGNLMHKHGDSAKAFGEVDALLSALDDPPADIILVTNETGCGVIPANAMARRFRDLAGSVNQRIAARADKVILCVSGIPVTIKG